MSSPKHSHCFYRQSPILLSLATILTISPTTPTLAESKDICRGFAIQPERLAKLKFIKTKLYETKEYGVLIKFGARNQILSVFKYDDGQTHITDAFLQERLKSSKKAIEKATAKRKDKIVSPAKPLVWKMGNAVFHGVVYRVTRNKHKLMSYEYVGLSHNTACMLKVRYTDALDNSPETSLKRYKSYTLEAHGSFGAPKEPKLAAQHMFTAIQGGNTASLGQMNTNANAWNNGFRQELQRLMKQAGYYDGPIDGKFGPGTRRALATLAER